MVTFTCQGSAASLIDTPNVRSAPPPLFASLGWGLLGASSSAPTSVKEQRTGVEFSGDFCVRSGQRNCPRIAGAGTRTKRIAGIKNLDVYALALYVDERAARSALARKFQGRSRDEVASSQALFDELARAPGVEKTLVLVITSGLVNRSNFLDTMDQRLVGPLAAARDAASLAAFRSQFDGVEFRRGLRIAFNFAGGRVTTRAAGKEVGAISSRALQTAMLDAYLGGDPVSKEAKAAFGRGLARMVLP